MSEAFFVYGLVDPRFERVRYVGVTWSPGTRCQQHIMDAKRKQKSKKDVWIRELLMLGINPRVKILHKSKNKQRALALERQEMHTHNYDGTLTNFGGPLPRDDKSVLITIIVPSEEDHQRMKEAAVKARRPLYRWAGERLANLVKPKQKKG